MACPTYEQVRPFDDTLTGTPKPATWPWVKSTESDGGAQKRLDGPVYTWILSDGHTGSTALAGLIATSPHVSTLCTSGFANCEGEKILMHMTENMTPITSKQRGQMKRGVVYDINWFRVIREYSR